MGRAFRLTQWIVRETMPVHELLMLGFVRWVQKAPTNEDPDPP